MLFGIAQFAERLVDLTMPRGAVELANKNLRLGARPGGEVEPHQRFGYVYAVGVGWGLLGGIGLAGMIILALLGDLLAGPSGRDLGATLGGLVSAVSVGGMFATVPYLTWAWWAGFLARRAGPRSPAAERRIKAAVRRAHPSERVTCIVQVLAVLYTLWLVTGH